MQLAFRRKLFFFGGVGEWGEIREQHFGAERFALFGSFRYAPVPNGKIKVSHFNNITILRTSKSLQGIIEIIFLRASENLKFVRYVFISDRTNHTFKYPLDKGNKLKIHTTVCGN